MKAMLTNISAVLLAIFGMVLGFILSLKRKKE